MLEEGHVRRGLALDVVARLTADAAARRFGFVGRGRLEPGASADIAIVDLSVAEPLTREALHDRHRLSPYLGRTLRGGVRRTLLRGHTVWADAVAVGPPRGELVRPSRDPGTSETAR
jgi:allantoinase